MPRSSVLAFLFAAGVAALSPAAVAGTIKPLPEGTVATATFSVSATAERKTASADPMGERSHFKIMRMANVTCRMAAAKPQGVGPDGPTPQQKAIIAAAEAANNSIAEGEDGDAAPAPGSMEARIAACGENEACKMKVALDIANNPEARREAEAEEARNKAKMDPIGDANKKLQAMYLEPNWQKLLPQFDRGSKAPSACTGTITVNDDEVYRLGFDGGSMGDGRETRKGSSATSNYTFDVIWYDLKTGRMVLLAQIGRISGTVKSVNVGGRSSSRPPVVTMNQDWEASAGKSVRLEKPNVTTVPGDWKFALPIVPKTNAGFTGMTEYRLLVTVP